MAEYKTLPATEEFWKNTFSHRTKAWLRQTLSNNKNGINTALKTSEQIAVQNKVLGQLLKKKKR